MKRLLLPLLASLALPTAVSAGDLGLADFEEERLVNRTTKNLIKYKKISQSNLINLNCGAGGTHMKPCKIEFKNGLLIVDGSRGITPSQVKHLTYATSAVQGLYVYLIYEDSDNKLVNAGFGSIDLREGAGFQTRLLTWMNEGP